MTYLNRITSRTKLNIPVNTQIDPSDINVHFQKISIDCNYKPLDLFEISEGTRIPCLSTNMVRQFLENIRKTAVGPDGIPITIHCVYSYHAIVTFLNFSAFYKIDCHILFTVICHGTLLDIKRVMRIILLVLKDIMQIRHCR